MAVLHRLNGVKIIVEQDTGDGYDPRWGLLDILLGTTTVKHYAGEKSDKRRIVGVMCLLEAGCNVNDYANLKAGLGNAAVAYVSDQGAQGNYIVLSMKPQELHDTGQDVPVYRVTIELLKA